MIVLQAIGIGVGVTLTMVVMFLIGAWAMDHNDDRVGAIFVMTLFATLLSVLAFFALTVNS